jgi:hypothetical protein
MSLQLVACTFLICTLLTSMSQGFCYFFLFISYPCHVLQDLDDALHIEPIEGKPGRWRVGVHIADVSHFIPPFRSVAGMQGSEGLVHPCINGVAVCGFVCVLHPSSYCSPPV